jgi:hypothetical protein
VKNYHTLRILFFLAGNTTAGQIRGGAISRARHNSGSRFNLFGRNLKISPGVRRFGLDNETVSTLSPSSLVWLLLRHTFLPSTTLAIWTGLIAYIFHYDKHATVANTSIIPYSLRLVLDGLKEKVMESVQNYDDLLQIVLVNERR